MSPMFIPKEIIFYMLSFLPVKSLLRFKCVCKHWNAVTQDFQFICLHYDHSPSDFYLQPPSNSSATGEDIFVCVSSNAGLLLEYTTAGPSSLLSRFRIRNPAMRQVVELQDSENRILAMHVVLDHQVLKLLSVVQEVGKQVVGYEVLDLRNDQSAYSWQPFKQIELGRQLDGKTIKKIKFHGTMGMGATYCIWDMVGSPHLEIDILDMVNDSCIGCTTFPRGFDDSIVWNGKLAFVKIVKEELHVSVLKDSRKKQIKWAEETLIIKLRFLINSELAHVPQIKVTHACESKLFFWWKDKKSICRYDMSTGKVTTVFNGYNGSQGVCPIKTCCFPCKGIRAGDESLSP